MYESRSAVDKGSFSLSRRNFFAQNSIVLQRTNYHRSYVREKERILEAGEDGWLEELLPTTTVPETRERNRAASFGSKKEGGRALSSKKKRERTLLYCMLSLTYRSTTTTTVKLLSQTLFAILYG